MASPDQEGRQVGNSKGAESPPFLTENQRIMSEVSDSATPKAQPMEEVIKKLDFIKIKHLCSVGKNKPTKTPALGKTHSPEKEKMHRGWGEHLLKRPVWGKNCSPKYAKST